MWEGDINISVGSGITCLRLRYANRAYRAKIKDTFMTISQTAKKLKVRTYDYIRDRVSGEFKLPSLAQLIAEKSQGNFVTP